MTPEGCQLVEKVRDEVIVPAGKFFPVACSPLRRAKQTLAIIMGKEFPGSPELAPISEAAWIAAMTLASMEIKGTTLDAITDMFIREALTPLMIAEGEKTFRFIRQIAAAVLEDGQKALLVSHWPLIECALAFASNKWPPKVSLGYCEILAFQFNSGGKFIGWRQPHPLFT